jgi:hypothetical protein
MSNELSKTAPTTEAMDYWHDANAFDLTQRICKMMAASSFMPKHLKGLSDTEAIANCFRVVNQAKRWGLDPFGVMDEMYVVSGRLGYQGKLVAAVVNAQAGLEERLSYTFAGAGDARTITVSGRFRGEKEPRTIELTVAQARTQNQMWQRDPDQKLVYSGVTKWARRHCPEILLGVLTDDDLERIAESNGTLTVPTPQIGKTNIRQAPSLIEAEKVPEPVTIDLEASNKRYQRLIDMVNGAKSLRDLSKIAGAKSSDSFPQEQDKTLNDLIDSKRKELDAQKLTPTTTGV